MFVIPLKENTETEVLSLSNIYLNQIDAEKKQPLEDFKEFSHPEISYKSEDCLILISEKTWKQLQENNSIPISDVEQFGWYSVDKHTLKKELYEKIEPQRFRDIEKKNPNLHFKSFSIIRNQSIIQKQINCLTGGLALCYYQFRNDYDSFFAKLEHISSRWILPRELIDKKDFIVFTQLLMLDSGDRTNIAEKIFSKEKLYIQIYHLLKSTLYFLRRNTFTNEEYFKFISEEFSKHDATKELLPEFAQLYERYINKGLELKNISPLTHSIRVFFDLAQNDIANLYKVVNQNKEIPKTSLFLIGMYHTASSMDKQFEFGNVVPSFVNLLSSSIDDISINDKDIELQFRKDAIENNIDKFSWLWNYISALKSCKNLEKGIELLNESDKKNLYEAELRNIDREIQNLNTKISTNEIILKTKNENDELRKELTEEQENHNNTIAKNKEKVEALNSKTRELENKLTSEQTKNDLLGRDLIALRGTNEEIEKEMVKKNQEILNLHSDIKERESQISNHQNTIAENKKKIEELNIEIRVLHSDLKERDSQISNHQNTIVKNEEKIKELNKTIEQRIAEIAMHQDTISSLKHNLKILENNSEEYINGMKTYHELAQNELEEKLRSHHWFIRIFRKRKYNEIVSNAIKKLSEVEIEIQNKIKEN